MSDPESTIQDVSDTALWVAYCRAVESARPDALFRDPYAERLAGKKGESIAKSMGSSGRYTQWILSIRTTIIDRWIEQMIADGVDAVLNLGAGLDTRPYRMKLPPSFRWIEIDHGRIIEHKENFLASEKPICQVERIRLDLADRDARKKTFTRINEATKNVLVLTEGVLPYLTPAQVGDLADDLRNQSHFLHWIGEYFSKEVYRHLNSAGHRKRMQNAPFLFFPDDWLGFFKSHGWVEREIKYMGDETLKLNRQIPMPWWASALRIFINKERAGKLRRMTGFVMFRRA